MPSGIINEQITKAQLIEQLEQMKEGGVIEILTGDYIYRRSEKGFLYNDINTSSIWLLPEIVEMVMRNHPNCFINVPEESFIKGIDLGWQSGGNIFLDTITLKDGKLIVISWDSIGIYKDQEAFENGETLQDYFYEEN